MQGYDAGRTNHRADAAPPRDDVAVAWRTALQPGGPPGGPPVAYGDLVVAPDDGVIGVARDDGSVRFELDDRRNALALADADGYRTPTLVVGDATSASGVDATGGVEPPVGARLAARWRTGHDDGGFVGGFQRDATGLTPVARDGVVYHADQEHALVARDAASGRERFALQRGAGTARFAVGEYAYVSEYGGAVTAHDPLDGGVAWRHDGDENRWSSVAAADGVAYVNDGRGVTALDATDDGARLWRTEEVDTDFGVPTVTGDRVLHPSFDAVYGFDRTTGERVWKRALDVGGRRHVAVASDLAFVPTAGDELVAIDARTGRTAWTFSFDGVWDVTAPIVVDGRVFVNAGAELVCLEGSR